MELEEKIKNNAGTAQFEPTTKFNSTDLADRKKIEDQAKAYSAYNSSSIAPYGLQFNPQTFAVAKTTSVGFKNRDTIESLSVNKSDVFVNLPRVDTIAKAEQTNAVKQAQPKESIDLVDLDRELDKTLALQDNITRNTENLIVRAMNVNKKDPNDPLAQAEKDSISREFNENILPSIATLMKQMDKIKEKQTLVNKDEMLQKQEEIKEKQKKLTENNRNIEKTGKTLKTVTAVGTGFSIAAGILAFFSMLAMILSGGLLAPVVGAGVAAAAAIGKTIASVGGAIVGTIASANEIAKSVLNQNNNIQIAETKTIQFGRDEDNKQMKIITQGLVDIEDKDLTRYKHIYKILASMRRAVKNIVE